MKNRYLQQLRTNLQLNQKTAIFLLCFFLATIFWVFTSLSKDYETQITIPVIYKNIPFTKYFDSELPKELEFHFKGSGFKLAGVHFRKRPDSIEIDVLAHSNNMQQLKFQTINLKNQFPGDYLPYRITPENISAGFNSRLSKKVPVKLVGQISYGNRFEATGSTKLVPDSVELAGSGAFLNKVSEVKTQKLKLSNVSGRQTGVIDLDSTSFPGLASSTSKIEYDLPVEEFTEGVMYVDVDLPFSQKNRVLLLPGKVKVTFIASLSEFPTIKNTDFHLETLVPNNSTPGKLAVKIKKQPLSVRVLKIEPEFLDYLVQK